MITKNDILEFDINEIVKKEVIDTINIYKKRLEDCSKESIKLKGEIRKLSEKLSDVDSLSGFITHLRNSYSKIQSDLHNMDYPKNKFYKQFLFIESIMKNLFDICREYNYRIPTNHYGGSSLAINIAINYYNHKDIVIDILKIFDPSNVKQIEFINNFKMPFDYPKQDVVRYVQNPNYNTNGHIFGISDYWLECGAGKGNMPHDLIMKNPHILESDVFSILLDTIRNQKPYFYLLFALPKYNDKVSKDQIELLGECILQLRDSIFTHDTVSEFVRKNLHKFNDRTLDFLFHKITYNNQFYARHWENFPVEYQMKYLKSKPFSKVYEILNSHSCKWSIEDKEKFLKKFLTI